MCFDEVPWPRVEDEDDYEVWSSGGFDPYKGESTEDEEEISHG